MSIVMKRTSIRKFKDTLITKEEIHTLLQSAMQAPSAKNQQPWDFIVVDDPDYLDEMSKMHTGSWPLQTAPLAIIPMIRKTEKSPYMTQQDMGACVENILLEAVNLGLGAVWIGVYPLEERIEHLRKIFNFKGETLPFAIIALGHPDEEKEVKIRYDESRVQYNEWNE